MTKNPPNSHTSISYSKLTYPPASYVSLPKCIFLLQKNIQHPRYPRPLSPCRRWKPLFNSPLQVPILLASFETSDPIGTSKKHPNHSKHKLMEKKKQTIGFFGCRLISYCPKDPFVCPKNSGFTRSNPMTWGWD